MNVRNKIDILTNEKKSLLIEYNVPNWYINLNIIVRLVKIKDF
ncbi:MAG: hypothetical protein V8S91_02235 [Romboutsia timonensis]